MLNALNRLLQNSISTPNHFSRISKIDSTRKAAVVTRYHSAACTQNQLPPSSNAAHWFVSSTESLLLSIGPFEKICQSKPLIARISGSPARGAK
jgi:hypothetical protein